MFKKRTIKPHQAVAVVDTASEALAVDVYKRQYQEIPAERMNGIKGIGFELKDGSDYEGPFPILTGQTIDMDTIQAIDY